MMIRANPQRVAHSGVLAAMLHIVVHHVVWAVAVWIVMVLLFGWGSFWVWIGTGIWIMMQSGFGVALLAGLVVGVVSGGGSGTDLTRGRRDDGEIRDQ
jgi:hypothetical protein